MSGFEGGRQQCHSPSQRFALLTILLQCVLQDSLGWLRKTSAIAAAWECDRLVDDPD